MHVPRQWKLAISRPQDANLKPPRPLNSQPPVRADFTPVDSREPHVSVEDGSRTSLSLCLPSEAAPLPFFVREQREGKTSPVARHHGTSPDQEMPIRPLAESLPTGQPIQTRRPPSRPATRLLLPRIPTIDNRRACYKRVIGLGHQHVYAVRQR